MRNPTVRVTVEIPDDDYDVLKLAASKTGASASELIKRAVSKLAKKLAAEYGTNSADFDPSAMAKHCNKCHMDKPFAAFVGKTKGREYPYCMDCTRAYRQAYHAERKAEIAKQDAAYRAAYQAQKER